MLTVGVLGFYGFAVLPVFRLGFSVSALKFIGFAVFNIATVNGFWGYLGRFSGLYGRNVWFSDFRMKYLRRALSPQGARGMINKIATYIFQSDSWNGHENKG